MQFVFLWFQYAWEQKDGNYNFKEVLTKLYTKERVQKHVLQISEDCSLHCFINVPLVTSVCEHKYTAACLYVSREQIMCLYVCCIFQVTRLSKLNWKYTEQNLILRMKIHMKQLRHGKILCGQGSFVSTVSFQNLNIFVSSIYRIRSCMNLAWRKAFVLLQYWCKGFLIYCTIKSWNHHVYEKS